jgi:hypothetical protein
MLEKVAVLTYAVVAYLTGTASLVALIIFPSGLAPALSIDVGTTRLLAQALLIACWATPVMTVGRAFFAAEMTAFTFAGCYFVERRYLRLYGDAYREFQSVTPL